MKLSEWKPWRSSSLPVPTWPFGGNLTRDFSNLENRMLDLMRNLTSERDIGFPTSLEGELRAFPAIDIKETPESYVLEAELPGMSEKDIKLELRNNVLSIKGEKTTEMKKGNGYIYNERAYGAFSREIPLDEEVNMDKIDAVFKNGVLRVELQKTETSSAKRRKIEIHH